MDTLISTTGELIALCALIAVTECFTGEDRDAQGLRMICGLAVARSLILQGTDLIRRLL